MITVWEKRLGDGSISIEREFVDMAPSSSAEPELHQALIFLWIGNRYTRSQSYWLAPHIVRYIAVTRFRDRITGFVTLLRGEPPRVRRL